MNIKIIRSEKRKHTISARVCGGELFIYLPVGMPESEEKKWIEKMSKRMEAKMQKRSLDDGFLLKKAKELDYKYFDGRLKINSIEFVTNQTSKFGSCTPRLSTIRISHRLAEMPEWVLSYVVVHELAHLVHPNHSTAFWQLVNKYPYSERARGFLIAKGMEEDENVSASNP